ncbi:hypothetical protein BD779DRAFT_1677534 [Infundibulicybe gibba]|nr:hypothetical protein BD779DRAFT_1677534 [Infundibulicybe gibba]
MPQQRQHSAAPVVSCLVPASLSGPTIAPSPRCPHRYRKELASTVSQQDDSVSHHDPKLPGHKYYDDHSNWAQQRICHIGIPPHHQTTANAHYTCPPDNARHVMRVRISSQHVSNMGFANAPADIPESIDAILTLTPHSLRSAND